MCHDSCIAFGKTKIKKADIKGKSVIEAGSCDSYGSLRPIIEALASGSYIGVDIQSGPGVDFICDASMLVNRFGRNRFDVLLSTELLEDVKDWKRVISNFKNVVKPGGLIIITTRSRGFNYHGYPFDFWRYEIEDIEFIFSDFAIKTLEKDSQFPGIFLIAKKPDNFVENKLIHHRLYSILLDRRATIAEINFCLLVFQYLRLHTIIKAMKKKLMTYPILYGMAKKVLPGSIIRTIRNSYKFQ